MKFTVKTELKTFTFTEHDVIMFNGERYVYWRLYCMFEKLINILETYGTDIRSTRSMISARKDVGDLALVFNILKFSDDFMIFIAFEGIDGKWITVWETIIPATNEQELHSTVGKMRDVFKVFETYLSENSIGDTSNLFKRIIDMIQ